jgi:hypothetical protein
MKRKTEASLQHRSYAMCAQHHRHDAVTRHSHVARRAPRCRQRLRGAGTSCVPLLLLLPSPPFSASGHARQRERERESAVSNHRLPDVVVVMVTGTARKEQTKVGAEGGGVSKTNTVTFKNRNTRKWTFSTTTRCQRSRRTTPPYKRWLHPSRHLRQIWKKGRPTVTVVLFFGLQ